MEHDLQKGCLSRFCKAALRGIALCICVLIFALNFLYTAEVQYNVTEKVSISYHFLPSLCMIAVFAALIWAMARFLPTDLRVRNTVVFGIFSIVYLVMAWYLISNVDHGLWGDAGDVYVAAQEILDYNYLTLFPGGYIYTNPHQLGLMIYDIALSFISKDTAINFAVNYLFVIGINYFNYRIADGLFQNEQVSLLTIITSFVFLPQFFFILFAYGLIPGFFFAMLAFYSTLEYLKQNKVRSLIGMLVGVSAAVIFKMNFLIAGIAIIIVLVLKLFENGKKHWHYLAVIALLAVCMLVPSKIPAKYCESKVDTKLDSGIPSILWLAMGTDIDNTAVGPGWIDSSNYGIYYGAGYDKDLAAERGMEKMSENLQKMKEDPLKAIRFFRDKTISQWCEPMYQSVWSGPMEDVGLYTHTKLLKSIYNNGTAEDVIGVFSKFLTMAIWGLASAFLLFHHKKQEGWELFFLFCIGGVLFHTGWEAKSQYTYPYMFCLIPFAMYSMWDIVTKVRRKVRKS